MPEPPPSVSVILAVLDEIDMIDACLEHLAAQDYAGPLELVVADGGSRDGTRYRLAAWQARLGSALVLVDNPNRHQAYGLNTAAAAASGEVLVRADGHSAYDPDYVRRSVEALLRSDAVAVGGNQRAQGVGPLGQAVAAAMASPWGVGPARYRRADRAQPADTVYLGAFRKKDFDELGGYRYLPSGACEDADLYFRWRQQGRTVLLDPAIRSCYRPREHWGRLMRQYLRYGTCKAEMLFLNGRLPSLRPLAPLGLVAGLAAAAGAAARGRRRPLALMLAAWGAGLGAAAAGADGPAPHRLRVAAAVGVMHASYGTGLAAGLLRGPPEAGNGLRRAVRR